jgi:hypothetical protein
MMAGRPGSRGMGHSGCLNVFWEKFEMCLDAERDFSSNPAPRECVGHGNGSRFGEARFGPRRGFAHAGDHVSVGNYPVSFGWG